MYTSCYDALNQEAINQLKVARMRNTFPPSIWGDYFLNFSLDNELWEKYSAEDEELKEQVRRVLINEQHKPSEKMIFIDTLERLGVAYHFENEIEEILQQLFKNFEYNEDYDLYNFALHFRIFRKHGFNMSCEAFNKFKGNDGKLKETLANDARGMLSLYEAANLATHGDDILDEALVFTKNHLITMIPNLNSALSEQVKRSMDLCLHRSLTRIEARNYIDKYGEDPSRDETLLRFAKIDYNLLQLLHLQELSGISKWWKDLASKFPYARDRIVECYIWSLGVYFEPLYTVSRTTLTKVIAMASLLDDTFDSYGTIDELKNFSDVVERWDANAVRLLPDYLKILYKALLDLFEDLDQQFVTERGSYAVDYVKKEAQNLVKSYFIEAKWFLAEDMPSFDDYLENALITSSYSLSTPASFLGMGEAASNEELFDWLRNKPKVLLANALICRLVSDIATYEIEKARGQKTTGIECYMHQYSVTKEAAVNEFNVRAEKAWKDLNTECLKATSISKHILKRMLNFSRLVEIAYRNGDGYTNPEKILKDPIVSLLKNPIPLV